MGGSQLVYRWVRSASLRTCLHFAGLVVFLTTFSALTQPGGSQNYSQFLTSFVCENPSSGLCVTTEPPKVLRSIETQSGVPYRIRTENADAEEALVEIGSINPANTLRKSEPHTRLARVLAVFVTGDASLTQLRIIAFMAAAALALILATHRVLADSDRKWFLAVLGLGLVLGDHLANSASFAPIGLSTAAFICAISLCAAINLRSESVQHSVFHQRRGTRLLGVCALVVASTRIDQYVLLLGLAGGVVVQGMLNATCVERRLTRRQFVPVVRTALAFVPSVVVVGRDRFLGGFLPQSLPDQVADAPDTSGGWGTVLSELLRAPGYFALDLLPEWSRFSITANEARLVYAAIGAVLLAILLYRLLQLRGRRLILFFLVLAAVWTVVFGALVGPRAELRYVWAAVLGAVYASVSSVAWGTRRAWLLQVVLAAGFATGVAANVVSLLGNFDSRKRFWLTDHASIAASPVFLVVLVLGSWIVLRYFRLLIPHARPVQ